MNWVKYLKYLLFTLLYVYYKNESFSRCFANSIPFAKFNVPSHFIFNAFSFNINSVWISYHDNISKLLAQRKFKWWKCNALVWNMHISKPFSFHQKMFIGMWQKTKINKMNMYSWHRDTVIKSREKRVNCDLMYWCWFMWAKIQGKLFYVRIYRESEVKITAIRCKWMSMFSENWVNYVFGKCERVLRLTAWIK